MKNDKAEIFHMKRNLDLPHERTYELWSRRNFSCHMEFFKNNIRKIKGKINQKHKQGIPKMSPYIFPYNII